LAPALLAFREIFGAADASVAESEQRRAKFPECLP
jgi:hypothetical protein